MAEAQGSKKGSSNIIIAVLGTVVVLMAVAAGVFFFFGLPGGSASGFDRTRDPLYFAVDPLVVNLVAGKGAGNRFLKTTPVIMTRDSDLIELLEQEEPRLRSEMIRLLREQDPKTLMAVDGFDTVRGQMLALTREVVVDNDRDTEIEALFFTDFVVQ